MVTAHDINWSYLTKSLDHFRYNGFTPLEVPWLVSEKACRMTCPSFVRLQESQPGLYLVGSAEQSFLELELQNKLPKGRYVALTPCFRDEPVLDELHHRHFMKVELYITKGINDHTVDNLVDECVRNFSMLSRYEKNNANLPELQVVKTPDGYDIELNGIEIGSYGLRSVDNLVWVYGTAMAEPRFSTALYHK